MFYIYFYYYLFMSVLYIWLCESVQPRNSISIHAPKLISIFQLCDLGRILNFIGICFLIVSPTMHASNSCVQTEILWYILLLPLSHFSCVRLCATPQTAAHQAPLSNGILQARTLEWVAISFSNAWKWKVKVTSFSRVRLWVTPWTAAYQAPPSMGVSRQEYWSGVHCLLQFIPRPLQLKKKMSWISNLFMNQYL